jgi:hypothetical protein
MKKFTLYVRLFREVLMTSVAVIKLTQLLHDFVLPALNYIGMKIEKLCEQNPFGRQQICLQTRASI